MRKIVKVFDAAIDGIYDMGLYEVLRNAAFVILLINGKEAIENLVMIIKYLFT